jgi:hypothetical protein
MTATGLPPLENGDWRFDATGGLAFFASKRGESPIFDAFFSMYDRAFVLPDEKEDREGFKICLDLNHGARGDELAGRYGAFAEVCAVAYDAATSEPVGGANFIALSGSPSATANLNYIFVAEGARGRGYFRRLADGVRELIHALFPAAPPLVFIEQNDPLAMSQEAYDRDTAYTGLDQFDRLRMWAKIGARVVDFPYVQPPLSDDQDADESLLYSVLGAGNDALDAGVLERHLKGFFGISVLKGRNLEEEPAAWKQLSLLSRMRSEGATVPLRDPSPLLAAVGKRSDAARVFGEPPESFRAALKRFAARPPS